jgi:cytochrome c oxidase assembly protein subunit 11
MTDRANRRLAARLGAVGALMLAASFAAVPLYDLFCRVTGYGGTTTTAAAPSPEILDQTITVTFDANTSRDLAWTFRPMAREMEIRLGQTGYVEYEAVNNSDRPLAGAASFNVAPFAAGGYFAKIACFCFERQVLQPGERVLMPVTFYVDPAMIEDADARRLTRVTLSYTMHPAELPETAGTPGATEPNPEKTAMAAPGLADQR